MKRYYFHLVDGHDVIPDRIGVEIADLEVARMEAIEAIRDFRREFTAGAADWTGWRIDVTDASGTTVLTIELDDLFRPASEQKQALVM